MNATSSASATAATATTDDSCYRCRILLLRKHASEILLAGGVHGPSFPEIAIPRWQRATENINDQVLRCYRIPAHCLFVLEPSAAFPSSHHENLYVAMEAGEDAGTTAPEAYSWAALTTLDDDGFPDPADAHALSRVRRNLESCPGTQSPNVLGRPGWLRELKAWVQEAIAGWDLRLTGPVRQFNSGLAFSLLRLETSGPAVWFKATGQPNQHECVLTRALAKAFPAYLPHLIAVHSRWNGWLMFEAGGHLLEQTSASSAWQATARGLAELQTASVLQTGALLEAGAKDMRLANAHRRLASFLELMAEQMADQSKAVPAPLSGQQLAWLGTQIEGVCRELSELAFPDALGHLDFNPGNIVVAGSSCIFLDWAEGCVGHPFVTFEYLRSYFRRAGLSSEDAMTVPYLTLWEQAVGKEAVARARRLTPLLAVYLAAISIVDWDRPDRLRVSHAAGYLRSLTRRMWAEAECLSRNRCLG